MGYYEQEDIPFHWALAKAFTLADNYHCSVMGPTDTNRIFWEEGGNDPQGKAGGPVLETGGVRDLTYESGPETLYKAGISYKFYQGIGWPQDTITLYFKQFQTPGLVPLALYNAVTSTGTLFGDGTPGGIGNPENPTTASNPEMGFEEDCANGVLPDVSFIGSKSGFDEHPAAHPGGRRPVPRDQAGGPGRQRGAVEQHDLHHQLRRERRVLRPRRPADPEPDGVPRGVRHPGLAGRHPRRRPARSGPASGSRPSSSRPGRSAVTSSPRSPTTPPACG